MRLGGGRPRLPALRLTAPDTIAITPDRYRQTVDLLTPVHLRAFAR
jgi:hypothetical protein